MTRNGAKKQALKRNRKIFQKSAFADDVQSVFHPLISAAVVFRRCKLDRIRKLAEKTRDSVKMLKGVQMVRNFQFGVDISWMVLRIYPMNPLASAACASFDATCKPPSRRYALA